jgi:hypothetical protein
MNLRQIQAGDFPVLAVLEPVAGDSVLAVLTDARRFYPRLYERMMAALVGHTPTYGPPWSDEPLDGVAWAKRLYDGMSEFVALNREASRRKRARQPKDEREVGVRIFFFQYGNDVICTNGCYKTQATPGHALPSAFLVRQSYFDYLKSGRTPKIIMGDLP